MNKEQFYTLTEEQKYIATLAYIDGFEEAIEIIESIRIGSGDEQFQISKNLIVDILKSSLQKLKDLK